MEEKKNQEQAILVKPSVATVDDIARAQYEIVERSGLPTEKILSVMERFAQTCVATRQMPSTIDTKEKAMMVFQAGREMGIPPIKALGSFYFVNNKLTMYGPTVMERIRPWAKIEYIESSDKVAHVKITRKDDGTSLESKITMEELDRRGATQGRDGKKAIFTKHPRTMLLYKAVGEIVRHIVPEAVGAVAVEGDWGPGAEEDTDVQKGSISRVGAVAYEEKDGEVIKVEENIPTVPMIVKKYDRKVIADRLTELGVEYDEKETKGQLASKLVEKIRETIHEER